MKELYVIATQPPISYREVAEICVSEGIRFLQLREKKLSDKEIIAAAREIKAVTDGTDTMLVINDRPDIAKIVGADCLHLGQDDMGIEDARKIVGNMPIGLSTHNLDQVRAAQSKDLLYIGFGPVYDTTTKENPDPTVGTQLLSQATEISELPIIAIGGIFPENVGEVLAAGAQNICLVRHLMHEDMRKRIVELKNNLITFAK